MIIEHALLRIKPEQSDQFTASMKQAKPLISCQSGFRSIEVRPCVDDPETYLLLVGWKDVASHRDGFRKSPEYQEWRSLLHDFYDSMPTVSYFGTSIFDA